MKRMVRLLTVWAVSVILLFSNIACAVTPYSGYSDDFYPAPDMLLDDFLGEGFSDLLVGPALMLPKWDGLSEIARQALKNVSNVLGFFDITARWMVVDGTSMEPTLQHEDEVFVGGVSYEPKNGDVIVFEPKGDVGSYYVKRVIATGGQKVDIRDGAVYVDGVKLEEDYITSKTYLNEYSGDYPKTVPQDCVFVLGDNRSVSRDSRNDDAVGMVENDSILGKVYFRIFPLTQLGSIY